MYGRETMPAILFPRYDGLIDIHSEWSKDLEYTTLFKDNEKFKFYQKKYKFHSTRQMVTMNLRYKGHVLMDDSTQT